MNRRTLVVLVAMSVAAFVATEVSDSWARARGGGSRGSRSWSAPVRPAPGPTTPSSPSRSVTQPAPTPAPTPAMPPVQRRGFFSGFGGALAGFALGGLMGSLLFGGMRAGGSGIGLMDLVILGGLAFLVWQFFRRRREAEAPAYATHGQSQYTSGTTPAGGGTLIGMAPTAPPGADDIARGVEHIRQMDPGFDTATVADSARTLYASVQSAVAMRDVGILRDRLTPEMYNVLQRQCEELRTARRTNYIEKIQIDRSEVTEAWQEGGHDFVTVYFTGTMLDYTVDDATGQVVDGSKTDPVALDEAWTFARPVGPNKWKLGAIQSA